MNKLINWIIEIWSMLICYWYGHAWVRIDRKWEEYKCFRCYAEKNNRSYPIIHLDDEPAGNIIESKIRDKFGG